MGRPATVSCEGASLMARVKSQGVLRSIKSSGSTGGPSTRGWKSTCQNGGGYTNISQLDQRSAQISKSYLYDFMNIFTPRVTYFTL